MRGSEHELLVSFLRAQVEWERVVGRQLNQSAGQDVNRSLGAAGYCTGAGSCVFDPSLLILARDFNVLTTHGDYTHPIPLNHVGRCV